jgi:hypothetical protein
MLIDYNKFEIVHLGGYQIDHNFNKKLLNTLEDFSRIIHECKLNYYLSGSLCLSFITNKVHRTWKDIDIFIDEGMMVEWLDLFPKEEWFYFKFNKEVLRIYNKKNNNYVELNSGDPKMNSYRQKYLKITDYYGLKMGDINTFLFWKKNFRSVKKRVDYYDEIIVKEYLNKQ